MKKLKSSRYILKILNSRVGEDRTHLREAYKASGCNQLTFYPKNILSLVEDSLCAPHSTIIITWVRGSIFNYRQSTPRRWALNNRAHIVTSPTTMSTFNFPTLQSLTQLFLQPIRRFINRIKNRSVRKLFPQNIFGLL